MQTKSRQIFISTLAAVALFLLIAFIFFSALRSSSIFEQLLHDVYKIEIDILTLCEVKAADASRSLDRVYAVNLNNMLKKGILQYKLILPDPANAAIESLYYLIKNKLIPGTAQIVITNKEYLIMKQSISLIKSSLIEASLEQKRALSILFVLLLLTVGILLLVLFGTAAKIDKEMRRHKYQMDLAKNISESENKIHNLLSSELHDDIGQMLVFLKLKSINMKYDLKEDIDMIIDSVRNLSHNLKIPEFAGGKFELSVEELISQFSTVSSIKVEYTLSDFHNELYPDYYPILIFRVIQECLQNASKHSKARSIQINMVESAPFLIIRYKDDGVGIENGSKPVALRSIEERAELLNAELKIDTGSDNGLRIVLKIPFVKEVD